MAKILHSLLASLWRRGRGGVSRNWRDLGGTQEWEGRGCACRFPVPASAILSGRVSHPPGCTLQAEVEIPARAQLASGKPGGDRTKVGIGAPSWEKYRQVV